MAARHKWALDLGPDVSRKPDLKPVGDVPFTIEHKTKVQEADQTSLKIRKAWEVAKSPRPIFTMGAMYWMTPSQANLIFLSIIFTTLSGHVSAMLDVNTAFAAFEDEKKRYSLLPQKILYILIQLIALGIGVYKLGKYGLLPTTMADWLPYYSVQSPTEFATGTLL